MQRVPRKLSPVQRTKSSVTPWSLVDGGYELVFDCIGEQECASMRYENARRIGLIHVCSVYDAPLIRWYGTY
jgi:hypothetical protein